MQAESIKMNKLFVFPSNSITIFILVSFLLIFHIPNFRADEEQLLQICSNTTNFTSRSQFQKNLKLVLKSLVSNGSQERYFNTSAGVGPDFVYGFAQCRDDLSMGSCKSCLKTAALNLAESCPNGVNATLRYDHCVVRYSGSRLFSERGSSPKALYYIANISDTNMNSFTLQRDGLLNYLLKSAVTRPSRFRYGVSNYTVSNYIYGVVQCNRYLSPDDCEYCLNDMITWIPDCCNGSKGAQIFSSTCYLRYGNETFIEDSSLFALTPALSFPPVSAPSFPSVSTPTPIPTLPPQSSLAPVLESNTTNPKESNGINGGKSLNILLIIVPIISCLMLG